MTTQPNFTEACLGGDFREFNKRLIFASAKLRSNIFALVQDQDDTEDIYQDTVIKAMMALKKGKYAEQSETSFTPWILRIARNLCMDYFRKGKKMPEMSTYSNGNDAMLNLPQKTLNAEQAIISEEMKNIINKLVDALPHDQREVVRLRYFEALSFKEIAKETNVSINTSLGRMRYALINIRRLAKRYKLDLAA